MSASESATNRRKFLAQTSTIAVALRTSGPVLAGWTAVSAKSALAEDKKKGPPDDRLVDQEPRTITPLALNPDGTAKEFTEAELTPVDQIGVLYRFTDKKPPEVEFDAAKHKIRIRGNVMKHHGGLGLSDLEKLPPYTQITKMQCGSEKPSGIIKWSGVRFADLCRLLEVQPMCHYVMFVAADGYVTTEEISTATHPQTILAWEMNNGPIPPVHGAPYRLVIPVRWAARHVKAISEIRFTATSFGYNNS